MHIKKKRANVVLRRITYTNIIFRVLVRRLENGEIILREKGLIWFENDEKLIDIITFNTLISAGYLKSLESIDGFESYVYVEEND